MYIGFHDGLQTVVVAAKTVAEFDQFDHLVRTATERHCTEFSLYGMECFIAKHASDEEKERFATTFGVTILPRVRALAMHTAMIDGSTTDDEPSNDKTIGELLGIAEHDPWDQRTDEQRESDAKLAKKFEAARKKGVLTDESFEPPPNQSGVHVTDVYGVQNGDRLRVTSVVAVKDHSDPNAPQVEEGVDVVVPEKRKPVDAPRPWNARSEELAAMSDDDRKAVLAKVRGREFIFTGQSNGIHGTIIYITPAEFFATEERMWEAALPIQHLLPRDLKEIGPGVYRTYRDWIPVQQELYERGFEEDLFSFGAYVNGSTFF